MNVLNFDITEKLYKETEELDKLYEKQSKLYNKMLSLAEEINQRTFEFDESFAKYIRQRNYKDISEHLCRFSAIVTPKLVGEEIIYFYNGRRLEQ